MTTNPAPRRLLLAEQQLWLLQKEQYLVFNHGVECWIILKIRVDRFFKVKNVLVPFEALIGRFSAVDIINDKMHIISLGF